MNITIIGAGKMARGIATRAMVGGNRVLILARDIADAEQLASELGRGTLTGMLGDDLLDDIVVLAVPYQAVGEILSLYRDQLVGKVLVDITNPIDFDTFQPMMLPAGSAAQEIAAAAPGARVVKAFNTTFAGTLIDGHVAGRPLDVARCRQRPEREAGRVTARH